LVVREKNDAVPAYTLPVPPAPLSASEGNHIPLKRISFKCINCPLDLCLNIAGQPPQLLFGFIRKFNVPVHV
jgi:hypothetical protein